MNELEIICPKCSEINLAAKEDLAELTDEDVLECESCGAFLQVISLDPVEVAIVADEGEGMFVECPECGLEFELEGNEDEAICPECSARFTPDWSDVGDEDE